jgi:transposase
MARAYSADMRQRVIDRVESGASRREAAEHYEVSPSTAVIWVKCFRETGRCAAKPRGGSTSPLEKHADFLLALIELEPDLTLDEVVGVMRELKIPGSRTAVWRFFQRHKITFKKSLRAAEQERADVARARRRWMREQGLFDPAKLVFIDESVLQSAEGVQHELKPFVKLRERWGRAPRDRLSGAGLKPVRAAAVKSRGGERRIKSSDQTEQVSVRKTNESEPSEDASL